MSTATLYCGHALAVLQTLPSHAVQCCVTSPPFYGLRDYGTPDQIGREPTPDAYVAALVEVFRAVRRVLRDDGSLWLNLGDSFTGSANAGGETTRTWDSRPNAQDRTLPTKQGNGLKPKDLIGIPWLVAFALRADGWYLRSEIIWCLSGGTWVYARTQKGDMPMMARDIARLNPRTVQLWNGERWTQLLGTSRNVRQGTEIAMVLRSGERIACTPTHQFPTQRGLLQAQDLQVGDILQRTRLPEPEAPLSPKHLDCDAAWLAGLYVAEGSMSGETIQIAGHIKEEERWERIQKIAAAYGGKATRTLHGNMMNIRLYGKMLRAILAHFITGRTAKDKGIAPVLWRYSNSHLTAWLEGYCGGDGSWDAQNQRWRIGFTRNYNLERDLRTLCARLGYHLVLNLSHANFQGQSWPTFKGEIRTQRSGHHNEKNTGEIIAIQKARCREVYDLGVADEPHLFALASGILTHNSKPNAMPESVQDRPTKAHEQLFLLSKSSTYYYDALAIQEPNSLTTHGGKTPNQHKKWAINGASEHTSLGTQHAGRNKRSVWSITTAPYAEAHFACMPEALVLPCILAGTSAYGACVTCGAPWERVIERVTGSNPSYNGSSFMRGKTEAARAALATVGTAERTLTRQTTGWQPTCPCGCEAIRPCVVLDPFGGSGTTAAVALGNGRDSLYIDNNREYLALAQQRIGTMFCEEGTL